MAEVERPGENLLSWLSSEDFMSTLTCARSLRRSTTMQCSRSLTMRQAGTLRPKIRIQFDQDKKSERHKNMRDTLPPLPLCQNDKRRRKYKPTLSKPKQYTTLETLINNSLHTIKDKLNLKSQNLFLITWRIGVQMVISPFTKAPDILVVCSRITLKG